MSMKPKNNFQKKERDGKRISQPQDGGYWIYGKHTVSAALANPNRKIMRILAGANSYDEFAAKTDAKIEKVDLKYIDALFPPDATHQGIAARVKPLDTYDLRDCFSKNLVVILDQVSDPHNVGAVLRSAAAFGAGAVIIPADNSPSESAVMAKSASGAMEVVPLIRTSNLAAAIDKLKAEGFWVIGLDGEAKTVLSSAPKYEKTVLVMGAEGKGLRRLTGEKCDLLVKLPISNAVESLNVSNAAAIALYDIRTKR